MFRCQAADVMAIRVGGLTPIFSSKDVKKSIKNGTLTTLDIEILLVWA
jgi:hypothetical protein